MKEMYTCDICGDTNLLLISIKYIHSQSVYSVQEEKESGSSSPPFLREISLDNKPISNIFLIWWGFVSRYVSLSPACAEVSLTQ